MNTFFLTMTPLFYGINENEIEDLLPILCGKGYYPTCPSKHWKMEHHTLPSRLIASNLRTTSLSIAVLCRKSCPECRRRDYLLIIKIDLH